MTVEPGWYAVWRSDELPLSLRLRLLADAAEAGLVPVGRCRCFMDAFDGLDGASFDRQLECLLQPIESRLFPSGGWIDDALAKLCRLLLSGVPTPSKNRLTHPMVNAALDEVRVDSTMTYRRSPHVPDGYGIIRDLELLMGAGGSLPLTRSADRIYSRLMAQRNSGPSCSCFPGGPEAMVIEIEEWAHARAPRWTAQDLAEPQQAIELAQAELARLAAYVDQYPILTAMRARHTQQYVLQLERAEIRAGEPIRDPDDAILAASLTSVLAGSDATYPATKLVLDAWQSLTDADRQLPPRRLERLLEDRAAGPLAEAVRDVHAPQASGYYEDAEWPVI